MRKNTIVALLTCSIVLSAIGSFMASKSSRVIISDNIEALTRDYEDIPGPNGITYRALQMGRAATPEEIEEYSYWWCGCYLPRRPTATYDDKMMFLDLDRPCWDELSHCADTDGIWPNTIGYKYRYCWARFGPNGSLLADF